MTVGSSTKPFSGQEPESQNREDILPADQGPIPPETDPKSTRFSAATITGMVLVSIVWVMVFGPMMNFLFGGGFSFNFIYLSVLLGPITLLGGATGFMVALIKENRKLAARLYIIPSLIWQGGALTAFLLLMIALAGYDAT